MEKKDNFNKDWNLKASFQEIDRIFKERGTQFGTVQFQCPRCGGKAHYVNLYTPERWHKITTRVWCENGCFVIMN